mgnify:CR=1 FL=1
MVKCIKLNNQVEMPMEGFGVFQVTDARLCSKAVAEAIETGYRLIDTASSYGNEEAVGLAIRESSVPREELFVTTKAYIQQMGYENTRKAFQESLEKLGLEYLDLYLIHMPFGDYYGSWRAMEDLYREGKVRSIGVSNFLPDRLMDLCYNARILPAVNQLECHPHYQREEELVLMEELGIKVQAWAPFAEGHNDIFNNEILKSIANKYKKTVPQVIIRWQIQRGIVTIPKSTKKERIVENFNIFDFELSNEDMELISTINTGKSTFFDLRTPEMVEAIANLKRNV